MTITTKTTTAQVGAFIAGLGIDPADFDCKAIAKNLRIAASDMEAAEWDDDNDGARPTAQELIEEMDTFALRDDAPMIAEALAA